ncbi:hypothetical protein J2X34_004989 [Rhodococcus sp. BE178]
MAFLAARSAITASMVLATYGGGFVGGDPIRQHNATAVRVP